MDPPSDLPYLADSHCALAEDFHDPATNVISIVCHAEVRAVA
jgi:hypothetical protein